MTVICELAQDEELPFASSLATPVDTSLSSTEVALQPQDLGVLGVWLPLAKGERSQSPTFSVEVRSLGFVTPRDPPSSAGPSPAVAPIPFPVLLHCGTPPPLLIPALL
jgi:hypothetical protein